jgi:hypothetical protein
MPAKDKNVNVCCQYWLRFSDTGIDTRSRLYDYITLGYAIIFVRFKVIINCSMKVIIPLLIAQINATVTRVMFYFKKHFI